MDAHSAGTGFRNASQQSIYADGLTFGGHNFGQGASDRAGDFDSNLICLQLTEHFIDRYCITGLLEPCRHGGFGH